MLLGKRSFKWYQAHSRITQGLNDGLKRETMSACYHLRPLQGENPATVGSDRKLKFANSSWPAQVGACEQAQKQLVHRTTLYSMLTNSHMTGECL